MERKLYTATGGFLIMRDNEYITANPHITKIPCIYLLTDVINSQLYIGATKNLYRRMLSHLTNSHVKEIKQLLSEYNPLEAITVDIIEEFEYYDIEEAHIKETRYIKEFNTMWPNGYNRVISTKKQSPQDPINTVDTLLGMYLSDYLT